MQVVGATSPLHRSSPGAAALGAGCDGLAARFVDSAGLKKTWSARPCHGFGLGRCSRLMWVRNAFRTSRKESVVTGNLVPQSEHCKVGGSTLTIRKQGW